MGGHLLLSTVFKLKKILAQSDDHLFLERHYIKNPHMCFYLLIYLFLAVLGLRCCTRAFSSCGERGLLFAAVPGLLIAVASLAAEHGL